MGSCGALAVLGWARADDGYRRRIDMTTTRRLAVAGASATVLVGGLFLGAPAAVAAPGDAPPGTAAAAEGAGAVPELPAAAAVEVPAAEVLVAEAGPPAPAEAPAPEPAPVLADVAPEAPGLPDAAPAAPAAPAAAAVEQAVVPELAPQETVVGAANPGLNVDTRLTAAPFEQSAGAGLLTALLAAAVALPGALAYRARRLGRSGA